MQRISSPFRLSAIRSGNNVEGKVDVAPGLRFKVGLVRLYYLYPLTTLHFNSSSNFERHYSAWALQPCRL